MAACPLALIQIVTDNIQKRYTIRHTMDISILSAFTALPYFTLQGFKQLAGEESLSAAQVRIILHRWAKAGHIIQLKRGVYMTRQFHQAHGGDRNFSAAISSILQPLSYTSLEFVLQSGNILTEITHPVTAVTIKHTRSIENKLGTFIFRHMRDEMYLGFTVSDQFGIPVAQATPAKALFDYLYFRPLAAFARAARFNLTGELRLNLEHLSPADREEFAGYVEMSRMTKMADILDNLRRYVWQP